MFDIIARVVPRSDHELQLSYADGLEVVVDFKPLIERGGVFAPLADETYFGQVAIGDDGRYIEWPGGLDFCADALRQTGNPVKSSMAEVSCERTNR